MYMDKAHRDTDKTLFIITTVSTHFYNWLYHQKYFYDKKCSSLVMGIDLRLLDTYLLLGCDVAYEKEMLFLF